MDTELQKLLESFMENSAGNYGTFIKQCISALPEGAIAAVAEIHNVTEERVVRGFAEVAAEEDGTTIASFVLGEPVPMDTPSGVSYLKVPGTVFAIRPRREQAFEIPCDMAALRVNGKWGLIGFDEHTGDIIEHIAARHLVSV